MSRGLVKWCWIECWRRRIRSISATLFGLWTVTLRSWACPNRPRPSAISTPSSLADAAHLLRAGNRVSYFLVQPTAGFTGDQVVDSVRKSVPGMDALTSETFAENSRAIVISMIGRPLRTMIGIAALVGVALVGLTVLAVTTEQMSDFGVLRALGVRPVQLCRTVIAQAALIAGLGYILGAGITYGVQFLVKDRLGDVTVEVTPAMLAGMAAATGVMAVIGSLIPVRRVTRIDPAQAFRR